MIKNFEQCKGKWSEGDRHGKVITKGIECEGKRGKHCPEGVPGTCGVWAIEFRDQHGAWKSVIKPGFTKIQAKEAVEKFTNHMLGSVEKSTPATALRVPLIPFCSCLY